MPHINSRHESRSILPRVVAVTILTARGANTTTGAATITLVGLIDSVNPAVSAAHPSQAGPRAPHSNANTVVAPKAT
jgi:hypothetical protein